MHYRYWLAIGSGIVLGLIFITSGVGKIIDPGEFLSVLANIAFYSFLPLELVVPVARWLPWLELVLGLSLIMGISAKFMASASSLLVIGFIFQNTWIIVHGLDLNGCGCLGAFEKQLQIIGSSEIALYIDVGMLALVLIILFCYPGKFLTLRPWFLIRRIITNGFRNNGRG